MAIDGKPTPLQVFKARAEARAILYRAGDFTFEEATEPLYAYAIESGLIADLGMQYITDIIDGEFGELEPELEVEP